MALKLERKRPIVTEFKFSGSASWECGTTFLLKEAPSFAELVPDKEDPKVSVANLIDICDAVRREYGEPFFLKCRDLSVFIDKSTDIAKSIIEELKI